MPQFTAKQVRACNEVELEKMFAQADTEESDLLCSLHTPPA
jgi:hypothetical protein